MFDKVHLHQHHHESPRGPSHVDVHEHKAPTDESIKLYHELLEKARAEIVSITLEGVANNVLSHVRIACSMQHLSDQLQIKIAFKLNGVEHVAVVDEDRTDRDVMARKIVEGLLKVVGDELTKALPRR